MLNFSSHLQWFQAKIGSYDKQIWETSVEQRILQSLENRPKREGSLNKELIDIDLVRGSTFSKAKPRHGLKSVIFNGLKKTLFFPYYINQWQDHLNKEVVYLFLFHYVIQMIQLTLYFIWCNSSEIMVEEIFLPIILALSLGVLHAHIIDPYTVKQRRNRTISTSNNLIRSASKVDSNISKISKPNSSQTAFFSQVSDSSLQVHKDNFKSDLFKKSQETSCSSRSKNKGILFRKCTCPDKELSDGEIRVNIEKEIVQTEGYDGETETKGGSSSGNEEIEAKHFPEEGVNDLKHSEIKKSCVEEPFQNMISTKNASKQIKIPRHLERSQSYNKTKPHIRRCSQSDIITVTNEEQLKKFISAKNKQIPDPTPIDNTKKEKEKTRRTSITGLNYKCFKSAKNRRENVDGVTNNSELPCEYISNSNALYNCAADSPASSKKVKPIMIESVSLVPTDEFIEDVSLDGNVTNQDKWGCMKKSSELPVDDIGDKISSDIHILQLPINQMNRHSISQPHIPISSTEKTIGRILVRKVSSADVSPTPSKKLSTVFNISMPLNKDLMEMSCEKMNISNPSKNASIFGQSYDQDCLLDLLQKSNVLLDNSVSSEDHSLQIVNLNEDTITKSHKKREEFKQLFVRKAQASLVEKTTSYNSASSSSRNSTSETRHLKMKRRHRENSKSVVGEALIKKKNRKEMVQSMSETEYDRMNSDVNSTGNSTSDAEEICSKVITAKTKSGGKEVSDLGVDHYEDPVIIDIGSNSSLNSKNGNNTAEEDTNRPVQSGDILNTEMIPDDPFVLWYKEAHAPGSLHGMTGSVSCYIWENDELKKTNLSLLDIGWSIIQAVERHEQDLVYSSFGFFIIIVLCFTPIFFRMYINKAYLMKVAEMIGHTSVIGFFHPSNNTFINSLVANINVDNYVAILQGSVNNNSDFHLYSWSDDIIPLALTSVLASELPIKLIILFGIILRLTLYTMTFLMLCVAENSFEQRLQYAKHFCRLTSSRRARKYYLPHFRLNKLANIKCWLSLRSYLKKRGPQRSVESIISSAFYMLLAMLSLVCVNLLRRTEGLFVNRLINWDLMICSVALGIFMMRFLILGTKITKKYRNLSVIITEQINLFLAMQARPHKKEELTLAHNVLRLAESLLKEVEGPFRICGWSMNPLLYNILKVVILSVFSTVLSDTCGFKMKLYKIKINPANW